MLDVVRLGARQRRVTTNATSGRTSMRTQWVVQLSLTISSRPKNKTHPLGKQIISLIVVVSIPYSNKNNKKNIFLFLFFFWPEHEKESSRTLFSIASVNRTTTTTTTTMFFSPFYLQHTKGTGGSWGELQRDGRVPILSVSGDRNAG